MWKCRKIWIKLKSIKSQTVILARGSFPSFKHNLDQTIWFWGRVTAFLRYGSHAIQFAHLKWYIIKWFLYICGIVQLSPQSLLEHFDHPQSEIHSLYLSTPNLSYFPSPRQLLLSISVGLPLLNISHNLTHTICGLLWLLVLCIPDAFTSCPCCNKYWYLIPLFF